MTRFVMAGLVPVFHTLDAKCSGRRVSMDDRRFAESDLRGYAAHLSHKCPRGSDHAIQCVRARALIKKHNARFKI